MSSGKNKMINIRVSNYQFEKLHKEADESGMEFSDYIRYKLSGNYKESEKTYEGGCLKIEYKGDCEGKKLQVNEKLIQLNHYMEQMVKDNKRRHAEDMRRTMGELWRLLN